MNIEVIETTSKMQPIRELFQNMINMLNKEEVRQKILSNNIKDLYHLIEQYRPAVYKSEALLAYIINLIAQLDMKKAELWIEQLNLVRGAGLFGMRISDTCLEFKSMGKLYICYCDIEYIAIHCKIFSDFAVDIFIGDSHIKTLVIYFDVLCMLDKPELERCTFKYLEQHGVIVDDLQIKFI